MIQANAALLALWDFAATDLTTLRRNIFQMSFKHSMISWLIG